MKDKSVLLVDNSNTRTKFRLFSQGNISGEMRVLDTDKIHTDNLTHLLCGWQFDEVLVSSVVPESVPVIMSSLQVPVRCVGVPDALPFVDFSTYPGANTLGADRIANSVALAEKKIFPAIAIDIGTAITFDVINVNANGSPYFMGGIIAPGLGPLKACLSHKTALLPTVSLQDDFPIIGRDTKQAMQGGLGMSVRGIIREILSSIQSQFEKKIHVVATGGDALWAYNQLSEIDEVDALLTFKGMARMLQSER